MRYLFPCFLLSNAILYSLLLPLWEGFDEPFHFGNVSGRREVLSEEIAASLLLAPASHIVQRNLPQVRTYQQYAALPLAERAAIQQELRTIPAELRSIESAIPNYEQHQAPLAYWVLAIAERMAGSEALWLRVLLLRLLAAIGGAWLLNRAITALAAELGLRQSGCDTLRFLVFATQMTWATLAHPANDWLAVPLAVWALVELLRYASVGTQRAALLAAVVCSLGLLTKAYFLAVVPLLVAVFAYRRKLRPLVLAVSVIGLLSGWWYVRNVWLYGSLTGMPESRALSAWTPLVEAGDVPWPATVLTSARMALWTGNNTFNVFSADTIGSLLALYAVMLGLHLGSRPRRSEWITIGYLSLFAAALAYVTVLSHAYTGGTAWLPSPWYTQVVVTPVLALAVLGAQKRPAAGRWLLWPVIALNAYILIATYVAKLIPQYGGYPGSMTAGRFVDLYTTQLGTLGENLAFTALGPVVLIAALTVATALLTLAIAYGLVDAARRECEPTRRTPDPLQPR